MIHRDNHVPVTCKILIESLVHFFVRAEAVRENEWAQATFAEI